MTDQNAFGSTATQAPPTAVPAAEDTKGRSSRALLLAGGVAVLVLAVFAYALFFMGGDSTDEGLVVIKPAPVPGAQAPADPAAAPADDPAAAQPATTQTKGRNPFVPLEVEAPADTSTGTTTAPTTDPTTDPTTNPTTDPTTNPTTTPTGATVTVTLVAVEGDQVATKVGKVNYTGLSAGDTFGTSFQVYAIFNDKCAGFLYGDSSFALCEGGSTTLAKL